MNDDWMDAFAPEDLDDPVLTRIDRAVVPPAPRRRRWPWLAVPLALAAGSLLWLGTRGPVPDGPSIEPVPAASIASIDVGAPLRPVRTVEAVAPETMAPETRVPAPLPPTVAVVPAVPTPPVVEAAPEAPQVAELVPKRPGLQLRPGASAHLKGNAAVLAGGVLTYRHDAHHEPGVREVRFVDPPVVARPVGTAFSASSRDGYAAVHVAEGEVWVERSTGQALASLRPGDEVLVFHDHGELAWVATGGLTLPEVVAALPRAQRRDERLVVSLLASLRLAARESLDDAKVPFVLEER